MPISVLRFVLVLLNLYPNKGYRIRIYRYLIFCLFLSLSSMALAQPSITGLSGIATHSGTITITGSSFGSKVPAAPLKYDDFENGTIGEVVGNGWITISNIAGMKPSYRDTHPRGIGQISALNDHSNGNYNAELDFFYEPGFVKIYTSGWMWNNFEGRESRNIKLLALRDTLDWNAPRVRWLEGWACCPGGGCQTGAAQCTDTSSSGVQRNDCGNWFDTYQDGWDRIEAWWYSDYGGPNGAFWIQFEQTRRCNQFSGTVISGDCRPRYGHWGSYSATDCPPGACTCPEWYDECLTTEVTHQIYWDEIYIDITQARIEVCDTSTLGARTHCEIQIPSAWSSTSATFTVNQGTFDAGRTAYVYLYDENGLANANGYPITFSGSTTNTRTKVR